MRSNWRFTHLVTQTSRVTEFNEKPQTSEGFISGGYFVFDSRRVWDYIGENPSVILEREPLQSLTRAGELAAFAHEGFWQPMDTAREYTQLNELWASGRAPWKIWK